MELFKTTDLYFASYLITCGCKFSNTEKITGTHGRTLFIIDCSGNDYKALSSEFFSGRAVVNISQFISTLKNLKAMCFMG